MFSELPQICILNNALNRLGKEQAAPNIRAHCFQLFGEVISGYTCSYKVIKNDYLATAEKILIQRHAISISITHDMTTAAM